MPSSLCATSSMPIGASSRRNSESLPRFEEASTSRESPGNGIDLRSGFERTPLRRDQLADARAGERDERVHFIRGEWRALGGALDLDDAAATRHDDVHVGAA